MHKKLCIYAGFMLWLSIFPLHASLTSSYISAPSYTDAIEEIKEIHNTINTLNDTLYKIRQSEDLFLYNFINTKAHNEFKEVIKNLRDAIQDSQRPEPIRTFLEQIMKNMDAYLLAIKDYSDALEAARRTYIQESTGINTLDVDISTSEVQIRGREIIQKLNGISQKLDHIQNTIKTNRNKHNVSAYDVEIYKACTLLAQSLNNYIATIIKKAGKDLHIK